VEIAEERVITFQEGLFGFESRKKYFLMEAEKYENFKWLQCIDDSTLCFLVVEPVSFMFNYALEIDDLVVDELGIVDPDEVLILAMVTIPEDPSKITANLVGPLVINASNRKARQVVSTSPRHKIKHFIIEEMQKNAEKFLQKTEEALCETPPIALTPVEEESTNAGTHKKI
jgi:flagellar assembly factor FliW